MSFGVSSKFTRFVTRGSLSVLSAFACFIGAAAIAAPFEDIVREAARKSGFVAAERTHFDVNPDLIAPGKTLFESKFLSLNGNISCRDCHLDEFGSTDGLPNAVAVGGTGKGRARAMSKGGILPRNTLPFWGRGAAGFATFFWDGKIDFSEGRTISQFGKERPTDDPFVLAVHLPPAEIREMLDEDQIVRRNTKEDVKSAQHIYAAVTAQLIRQEPKAVGQIAKTFDRKPNDISFLDIATSLAAFIRHEFRLKPTKFHRFVFEGETLTAKELRGAQLFYGKGKCSNCHSGPYLSDFKFHAIPFPQIGFGKNGFGIDYGRFNVTHDPADLYKFRTPPLFNVEKTAPYGHSGSIAKLRDAIIAHFDPLRSFDPSKMSSLDRHEYFKRLSVSAESKLLTGFLDDREVDAVLLFLKSLTF